MNREFWQRLQSFSLDDPEADFSFSRRLQRENGWTADYTRRVIEEYRRFLYLCVEAGHPVTPSDQVDQAWHLHLCYTRSYWEDLCRDTLGTPVHHGPTRGGKAEGEKFTDWYERTKDSYAEHFGHRPPSELWPDSNDRFRGARWQRVDRARSFVMPKSALKLGLSSLVIALFTVGCQLKAGEFVTVVVSFFGVFIVIGLIANLANRGSGGKSGCGDGGGSFWGGGGIGKKSDHDHDGDGGDGGCGGGGCGGGCGS